MYSHKNNYAIDIESIECERITEGEKIAGKNVDTILTFIHSDNNKIIQRIGWIFRLFPPFNYFHCVLIKWNQM